MLANRARVYQNNVRSIGAIDHLEPGLSKRRTHQLRIQLIHLAPVGSEAHFHGVPPNLNTGAPTFSFAPAPVFRQEDAGAKLRGHPSTIITLIITLINSYQYFLLLPCHFLNFSFTMQSIFVIAIFFSIN